MESDDKKRIKELEAEVARLKEEIASEHEYGRMPMAEELAKLRQQSVAAMAAMDEWLDNYLKEAPVPVLSPAQKKRLIEFVAESRSLTWR